MKEPQFFVMNEHGPAGYDGRPLAQDFLLPMPKPSEVACPTCGRPQWIDYAPGAATARIEKGDHWPDFVGGGSAQGMHFMVAQRVVDTMLDAGITGFEPQPVEVIEVKPKTLRVLPQPDYYWLRVVGRCELDVRYSSGKVYKACPACRRLEMPLPHKQTFPLPPLDETVTDDIFIRGGTRGSGSLMYCTRRVLELARGNRWDDAEFIPADLPGIFTTSPNRFDGIDYLGDRWPPQWYPEGYTPPDRYHGATTGTS